MGGRALRFAVVLLSLALPRGVCAQPIDAETERLFTEGVAMLTEGHYEAARERLESVRARVELPAVVYNLALAERGLGHFIEAVGHLERYGVLTQGRVGLARASELADLLRQARDAIARVTVRVSEAGCEVTVDGRVLPPSAGDTEMAINPGRHVFRASGAEFQASEEPADLGLGERRTVLLRPVRRVVPPPTRVVEPARARGLQQPLPLRSWWASQRLWSMVSLGAGAATLTLGVVGLALRDDAAGSYNNDPGCPGTRSVVQPEGCQTRIDTANALGIASVIGIVVAGGLIATAVTLYATAPRDGHRERAGLRCGMAASSAGLSCEARFW